MYKKTEVVLICELITRHTNDENTKLCDTSSAEKKAINQREGE